MTRYVGNEFYNDQTYIEREQNECDERREAYRNWLRYREAKYEGTPEDDQPLQDKMNDNQ